MALAGLAAVGRRSSREHEIEAVSQHPERLRVRALRLGEHRELVLPPERPGRLREAAEKPQIEVPPDLVRRATALVERIPEEREPDARDQSQEKGEDPVSHNVRADLTGTCRAS